MTKNSTFGEMEEKENPDPDTNYKSAVHSENGSGLQRGRVQSCDDYVRTVDSRHCGPSSQVFCTHVGLLLPQWLIHPKATMSYYRCPNNRPWESHFLVVTEITSG